MTETSKPKQHRPPRHPSAATQVLKAVEAERERCARIADQERDSWPVIRPNGEPHTAWIAANTIARKIRGELPE